MLLREKDKNILIEIFQSIGHPIEIWAYGSRVNGTAHDTSDLDLVIRSPDLKPLDSEIFFELVEKIKESNIPILVELKDWSKLPTSFYNEIEKKFEILYSNIPK